MTLFLLCRSTQPHATTSCRSQFATTCDSSYVLQNTTPYWKSTTPVLPCTTKYSSVLLCTTKCTPYYKVLLQYYSVLHSATPVLLCTTIQYYSVLLQYYSVLQSATPVLLCTTQCYSSTTLYYKVLLQYYSVLLQYYSVLQCYSSTTLYYKVLLQYYSVLQSTTPVLEVLLQNHRLLRLPRKMTPMIDPHHIWNVSYNARSKRDVSPTSPNTAPATESNTHHWSSSHMYMKRYLQCAEQQVSLSKLTKYCACHEKWISWLILDTNETLFTMRGATCVIVQTHQILRLPRKMNLMIDPWHKWNVIYNARNNMRHSPNSPNTAPATKNDRPKSQRNLLKTDETSFPMRGRSDHDPSMIRPWSDHETVSPQPASQPRLPFTPSTSILYWKIQHFALRLSFQISPNTVPATKSDTCTSPNTAPATKSNTHHWSSSHMYMKRYLQCAEQQVSLSKLTKYCACHEKWISWLILDTNETLFTMRGATCVIVQTHQILRLPRKMNLMIDPWHKWNVIYNPRNNMRHSPNSPNTAPATKNDRPKSQRNLLKTDETHFQCAADPSMIRPWSDHETVSPQPASQPRLPFTPSTSILYWKIQHFALRLSFQISPNTAPATKSDTCTSPNTAPATKSNTHHWSSSHMKRYLQCAEQQVSLSKLTKYCACHEKWISWLILDTNETLFTMRGATCVIVQTHQILRLPRKMTVQNLKEICWKRMKRHFQCAADPSMIRPWSDHETVSPQPASQPRLPFTPTTSILYWKIQHFALRLSFQISPNTAPATKSDTWTSPNTATATKSHEKLHLNFTKLRLPRKVTLELQVLRLPRKVTLELQIEPLLDWAMTSLSYYLTELLLDWATMTWLSYDLTELLLDWAMTSPSYYLTELWLDWAMTWLSYDLTELWLDWAMTSLSYDLTELLWLDWATMTWLSYYDLTELLWLDWATMTWLSYYDLTELLWLDSTIT